MDDERNESKGLGPLEPCTTAPSAEHARAAADDLPCNDFRAETGTGGGDGGSRPASAMAEPANGDALLIIDVQNDFLPGGALAVAGGEEIVPVLNRYLKIFDDRGLPILATRDWHPANHGSFRAQGGVWPPHCVQGTVGSAFVPGLHLPGRTEIISTGVGEGDEGYSGFEGGELDKQLKAAGVRRLWVGGLATDYCVLHTVEAALQLGYTVFLIKDAVRAVNVASGDGDAALERMLKAGASLVASDTLASK